MRKEEFRRQLEQLDSYWLSLFCALLLHRLTVEARDTYAPGSGAVADPERLRSFNEIVHRISAASHRALHPHEAAEARGLVLGEYPDDEEHETLLGSQLVRAFGASLEAVSAQTNRFAQRFPAVSG